MKAFGEGLVTILLSIVGLAIVAVLVSKNAQTGNVLQSGAGGFAEDLLAAESPVTGNNISVIFPNSTGFPMSS